MASDETRKLNEVEAAYEKARQSAVAFATEAKEAQDKGDESAANMAYQSAEKALAEAKELRSQRETLTQSIAKETQRRAAITGELDEMVKADADARAKRQQATLDSLAGDPRAEREADREDARQRFVNADYKPRRWDETVGPAGQHAVVRQRMGDNLKAADKAYQSAFLALYENGMSKRALEMRDPDSYRTLIQQITTTVGGSDEPWIPEEFISTVSVDPGTPGAALLEACTVIPANSKKGKSPKFAGADFDRRRVGENAAIHEYDVTAGDVE